MEIHKTLNKNLCNLYQFTNKMEEDLKWNYWIFSVKPGMEDRL